MTGGVYKAPGTYSPRHADPRLLAIPASRSRDCRLRSETENRFVGLASPRGFAAPCSVHCSTCVAQVIRGMMIWSSYPTFLPVCHQQVTLECPTECWQLRSRVALVAGLNPTSHRHGELTTTMHHLSLCPRRGRPSVSGSRMSRPGKVLRVASN